MFLDLENDGWTVTLLTTVGPQHCDMMGHLTIKEYMGFFDQAEWNLFVKAGFKPCWVRELNVGYADVSHKVRYIREILNGDTVVIRSAILQVGSKSVTSVHQMYNGTNRNLSAVLESVTVQFDLMKRTGMPLIPEVAEGAKKLIIAPQSGAV